MGSNEWLGLVEGPKEKDDEIKSKKVWGREI